MKNVDFKKLFILIGIIVAIVAVVLLITNLTKKNKLTEEETKNIEDVTINYYANLTEGYTTSYGGLDILFQRDEVTFEKLETVEILNTAIKYATDKGLNISVNEAKIEALKNKNAYGDINTYSIYNAEGIRTAIKELFGVEKYSDESATNNYNYLYDYIYDYDNDVYLVKRNKVKDTKETAQNVNYEVISTEQKDEKVIVTIAIAYSYETDSKTMYAKDPDGVTIISEDSDEFPTDKIDEFEKFEFTLKKSADKKYTLESIKKVK